METSNDEFVGQSELPEKKLGAESATETATEITSEKGEVSTRVREERRAARREKKRGIRSITALATCVVVGVSAAVVLALPQPRLQSIEPVADTQSHRAFLVCGTTGAWPEAHAQTAASEITGEEGEATQDEVSTPSSEATSPEALPHPYEQILAEPRASILVGETPRALTIMPRNSGDDENTTGQATPLQGSEGITFHVAHSDISEVSTQLERQSAAVAAAVRLRSSSGDVRGTSTFPCVNPTREAWLVGSQSGVGNTNTLVLTNPGSVAVRAQIKAYGSTGTLDLGSVATISVAAGATVRTSLDGILASDAAIALHVSSESGILGAWLDVSSLNGAKPTGVSVISPSSFGKKLVIPAVNGAHSVMRIVNPGLQTTLRASLHTPSGRQVIVSPHAGETARENSSHENTGVSGESEEKGATSTQTVGTGSSISTEEIAVPAESVLDVPLDIADAGVLEIEADSAVSAAVGMVSEGEIHDSAWAGASESAVEAALIYGTDPARLVLGSGTGENGTSEVHIRPVNATGTAMAEIIVSSDEVSVIDMPAGSVAAILTSGTPIVGAALSSGDMEAGTTLDWSALSVLRSRETGRAVAVR